MKRWNVWIIISWSEFLCHSFFFGGGGEREEEQRETEIGHQKAKIASNKNYVFEIIKKGFAINKPLKSCFA